MNRITLPIGALAITLGAVAVSRHAGQETHTAGHHGLEGWAPQKITDEKREKKEIEALLQEMHEAYRTGNQASVAARIQFPVLMITDDWKGEVTTRYWDRDTWVRATAPLFEHPASELHRDHHHDIFVVSDSLASVEDEQSVMMGKKKVTIRSASILVRKDRSWFVQATVEGGWGNTRVAKPLAGGAPPEVDQGSSATAGSETSAEK